MALREREQTIDKVLRSIERFDPRMVIRLSPTAVQACFNQFLLKGAKDNDNGRLIRGPNVPQFLSSYIMLNRENTQRFLFPYSDTFRHTNGVQLI